MIDIKEVLAKRKEQLAQNNLPALYSSFLEDDEIMGGDIGDVTSFLEECGIDTPNGIASLSEAIPSCYAWGIGIPASLTPNGSDKIMFPPQIKAIGHAAFRNAWLEGIDSNITVDLCGIAVVDALAFSGFEGLTNIVIDDSIRSIGEGAFGRTEITCIYSRGHKTEEQIRKLFHQSGIYMDDVHIYV